MASGLITRFPVTTIFELASRSKYGICPQLESLIRSKSTASLDAPPSEQAVREALELVSKYVSYNSLGFPPAIEVAEEFSANTIYFRSLDAVSGISVTSNASSVLMEASGIHLTGSGLDELGTMSVQGGTSQFSHTVDVSAFTAVDIYTKKYLFEVFPADTCVGKIFVKCFVPVSGDYDGLTGSISGELTRSSFSFGVEGEPDRWIAQTKVPITTGFFESWSYGLGLEQERDVLDVPTSAFIYLYSPNPTGDVDTLPTSGRIGLSVFYDSIQWPS